MGNDPLERSDSGFGALVSRHTLLVDAKRTILMLKQAPIPCSISLIPMQI